MRKLSLFLQRLSTGRVTATALVIFLLFGAFVLPGQARQAENEAGSPDTSLYYTAADLNAMAEAYGEAGRQAYVHARWTFDLIFPLVYGAFLISAVSWFSRRAFPAESTWQSANLAPVLGVLFDYLENSATSLVIGRYPAATPVLDSAAGVLTLLKWVFVGGSFILLLIGITVVLIRGIRGRRQPAG